MDLTIDKFREQCRPLAIRDRHHELLDLMNQAPSEIIQADEDLSFWYALALLSTVRYVEGKQAAENFISRYASPGNPLGIGRSHLLRSHLHIMDGDTEESYKHELKVVEHLPRTAYHERLRSWSTIDTMAGHMGDIERMEQAKEALAEVRNHLPFDQSWWYSFVIPNRADILAKRGFLEQAQRLLLAQLTSVPEDEVAIIRLRLAVIALEQQDPEQANEWLEGVVYDGPTTYWSTEAFLIIAQVRHQLGDSEGAKTILQDGLAERARHQIRAEFYRIQMQLCELWIQEGEIELADAWVSLASKSLDPWPRTFGHPIPNLILARLEMAKRNWDEAISLLETLRDEGICRNHNGLMVGIYAHLAYAHGARGDSKTSSDYVQLAVDAGEHGKFSRSFTVLGVDVRSFLTQMPILAVEARKSVPLDTRRLILSRRELEVLELVAAGKRNAEIAETLFVSVSTVKNHLANISKRLSVKNRHDAVYAARTMGLLPEAELPGKRND